MIYLYIIFVHGRKRGVDGALEQGFRGEVYGRETV